MLERKVVKNLKFYSKILNLLLHHNSFICKNIFRKSTNHINNLKRRVARLKFKYTLLRKQSCKQTAKKKEQKTFTKSELIKIGTLNRILEEFKVNPTLCNLVNDEVNYTLKKIK